MRGVVPRKDGHAAARSIFLGKNIGVSFSRQLIPAKNHSAAAQKIRQVAGGGIP